MDSQRQLTWQMTVIMSLSIGIFGGGTMFLLVIGREVPGALWAIVGGLVNTIVSLGGFFNMRQMHAASLWHLAQAHTAALDHVVAVPSGTTTTTTGTEVST